MTGKKTTKRPTKKQLSRKAKITQCVGYIRVSTDDQADSGLSLENQKIRIPAYAAANGWDLVSIHEDAGVSAKTLDRPGLRAALKELQPGRILVALKLDRFTRFVPDLYELDALVYDRGGEWATISESIDTTTATGRMMRTFIATIAEWERGIISERTSAALGEKKRRKERLGTTPLGWQTIVAADGARLVVEDQSEMATVRLARQLNTEGKSLRQIAGALTAAGHQTKRGGKWSQSNVARLLQIRYLEQMATT